MNKQALLAEMQQTSAALQQTIAAFPQQVFNKIPFPGSWTPAQVCEHVIKSCSISEILNGNTGVTERDPQANVAPLRELFLNFDIKMESPEFILPSETPHVKETIAQELKQIWDGMLQEAPDMDLSLTCLDFEMPNTGAMTRYEWLNFLTVHTKRHTHQLEKMFSAFGLPPVGQR